MRIVTKNDGNQSTAVVAAPHTLFSASKENLKPTDIYNAALSPWKKIHQEEDNTSYLTRRFTTFKDLIKQKDDALKKKQQELIQSWKSGTMSSNALLVAQKSLAYPMQQINALQNITEEIETLLSSEQPSVNTNVQPLLTGTASSQPPASQHKPKKGHGLHRINKNLKNEIQSKANENRIKKYGQQTVEIAKQWGINNETDLVSLQTVIHRLIQQDLQVPDNPSQIFFHRSQSGNDPNINVEEKRIQNNPESCATILNTHQLDIIHVESPSFPKELLNDERFIQNKNVQNALNIANNTNSFDRKKLEAEPMSASLLPHGGINCLVSNTPNISNPYSSGIHDLVKVRITLKDVLLAGGRIYPDESAWRAGAVIVELPQNTRITYEDPRWHSSVPSHPLEEPKQHNNARPHRASLLHRIVATFTRVYQQSQQWFARHFLQ